LSKLLLAGSTDGPVAIERAEVEVS